MSHIENYKELLNQVEQMQQMLSSIKEKLLVNLNGDTPPKGKYTAVLDSVVSRKDGHVLYFNYTVVEGDYKDKKLSRLVTMNEFGVSELLDIYKKSFEPESFSTIATSYDKSKDLNQLTDFTTDLIEKTFEVLWTPKEGVEGFTKLKVLGVK